MALLSEYAITPDVFDTTYYPHEEVGTARLETLKNVLLEESLLRNLHAGEWLRVFKNQDRSWHRRGLELLKKMVTQNRIRNAEAVLDDIPISDAMWCREAITSHHLEPLTGVISTAQIVNEVGENSILGRIDRLDSSPCWTCREPSAGVVRCLSEYEDQLRLIMNSSNSILFIDPHLDPSQTRYKDVLPLLLLAKNRKPIPLIEIHRVIYVGSGPGRQIVNQDEWENRFRTAWSNSLAENGLKVEIFIWDNHHDRYLITDLIGITLGNGFDTTSNPNEDTTWANIGRKRRDEIQRSFDPNTHRHNLKFRFSLP